jgi:hypothetical protein
MFKVQTNVLFAALFGYVSAAGAGIDNIECDNDTNGVCHTRTNWKETNGGLGMAVYLPNENFQSPQLDPIRWFVPQDGCVESAKNPDVYHEDFHDYASMQQFVTSSSTSITGGSSYKSAELSLTSTASLVTGFSSDVEKDFYSTALRKVQKAGKKSYSPRCMNDLKSGIEIQLQALPTSGDDVKDDDNVDYALFPQYREFLTTHGSHIVTSNVFGAAFYTYASTTTKRKNIERLTSAGACLALEKKAGEKPGHVVMCANYTKTEREEASKMAFQTEMFSAGGNSALGRRAVMDPTSAKLELFFNSTLDESDGQPIESTYQPVWLVLLAINQPKCVKGDAVACSNVQRAYLLEATYQGLMAYGCSHETSSNNHTYQVLKYKKKISGARAIGCWQKKTGCTESGSDCHVGGAGTVCYAYGASTFEPKQIANTGEYYTVVRLHHAGHYGTGINQVCTYHGFRKCRCHVTGTTYARMNDRFIWSSGEI